MNKKILLVICFVSVCFAQTLVPYRVGDKWGYAEYGTKKLVIPTIYDYAKPFAYDIGMVKIFDKWGFIDKTGKQLAPVKYDYITGFSHQTYCYFKMNSKYGYINTKGYEIVPAIYTSTSSYTSGYIKMFMGDSAFYFDTLGNSITEQSVLDKLNKKGEYTLVKVGEMYNLKDQSGKIITKRPYSTIYDFIGPYARVELNDKYGMIDKKGNEVIPLQYGAIYSFVGGVAMFRLNGKYGLMDTLGKIVVQPIYDDLSGLNKNIYSAELNDQICIIDFTGKEIIPFGKYTYVDGFFEGLAKVAANLKYGYIDTLGNEVIPLQYEDAWSFRKGFAEVKINGKNGLIDKTGKIVIEPKYGYIDYGLENGIIGTADAFTYYPTTYIDVTGQEYVGKYTAPKYKTYPEVTMWNTETRKIKSKIINEEYTLFINTTRNYKQTNKTYPVVYLLDADYTFGIARDAVESMLFGQEVPEMIIVGIAYDKDFDTWFAKRIRDYTPTNDTMAKLYPGGGGSEKFLQFINEELVPYVDKNFRVVPNERTLVGYSFGGLFGFYSLFKSPQTFSRYLLISPSLWWDNKLAFNWEKEYAMKSSDIQADMYLTVGGQEYFMITPLTDMIGLVKSHSYSGLMMTYEETPDRSHFSVFAPAFTKGIRELFKEK